MSEMGKWAAIFLLGREQYSLYIILGIEEREGEVTLRTLLESTHPRCKEVLSLGLPHLRRGLLLCSVRFVT